MEFRGGSTVWGLLLEVLFRWKFPSEPRPGRDPRGEISYHHDDVHTKIEMCKAHFEEVGLGADTVLQFIR